MTEQELSGFPRGEILVLWMEAALVDIETDALWEIKNREPDIEKRSKLRREASDMWTDAKIKFMDEVRALLDGRATDVEFTNTTNTMLITYVMAGNKYVAKLSSYDPLKCEISAHDE